MKEVKQVGMQDIIKETQITNRHNEQMNKLNQIEKQIHNLNITLQRIAKALESKK